MLSWQGCRLSTRFACQQVAEWLHLLMPTCIALQLAEPSPQEQAGRW